MKFNNKINKIYKEHIQMNFKNKVKQSNRLKNKKLMCNKIIIINHISKSNNYGPKNINLNNYIKSQEIMLLFHQ